MSKGAYDEAYLDSMLQKTRYLFKLIARNNVEPFSGIRDYMQSSYRKYMDMECKVDLEICENYDEFILEWMADVYTYLQWKYALPSELIVEKIPPEELYKNVLHFMKHHCKPFLKS